MVPGASQGNRSASFNSAKGMRYQFQVVGSVFGVDSQPGKPDAAMISAASGEARLSQEPTETSPAFRVCSIGFDMQRKFLQTEKVGVTGLEPATSCSQSRRSSQAELHPVVNVRR